MATDDLASFLVASSYNSSATPIPSSTMRCRSDAGFQLSSARAYTADYVLYGGRVTRRDIADNLFKRAHRLLTHDATAHRALVLRSK